MIIIIIGTCHTLDRTSVLIFFYFQINIYNKLGNEGNEFKTKLKQYKINARHFFLFFLPR
jgi:hypothetical protein